VRRTCPASPEAGQVRRPGRAAGQAEERPPHPWIQPTRGCLAALPAGTGVPADAPIAEQLAGLIELRLVAAQHVVRLRCAGELEQLDSYPPRAIVAALECCRALRLEAGDLCKLVAGAICDLCCG
jgi:hypothetical protein